MSIESSDSVADPISGGDAVSEVGGDDTPEVTETNQEHVPDRGGATSEHSPGDVDDDPAEEENMEDAEHQSASEEEAMGDGDPILSNPSAPVADEAGSVDPAKKPEATQADDDMEDPVVDAVGVEETAEGDTGVVACIEGGAPAPAGCGPGRSGSQVSANDSPRTKKPKPGPVEENSADIGCDTGLTQKRPREDSAAEARPKKKPSTEVASDSQKKILAGSGERGPARPLAHRGGRQRPCGIEAPLWEAEVTESESILGDSIRLQDFELAGLAQAFLDKCRSSRAEAAICLKDQDYTRAGVLQREVRDLRAELLARAKPPAAMVHAQASATRASGGPSAPASSGALAPAQIPVGGSGNLANAPRPTSRRISVPGETSSRAVTQRDGRTGPPVMGSRVIASLPREDTSVLNELSDTESGRGRQEELARLERDIQACLADRDYTRAGELKEQKQQVAASSCVAPIPGSAGSPMPVTSAGQHRGTSTTTQRLSTAPQQDAGRRPGTARPGEAELALLEKDIQDLVNRHDYDGADKLEVRRREVQAEMDTHALESPTGQDAPDQEGSVPPEAEDDFPPFDEVSKQVTLLTEKVVQLREYKKAALMQKLCHRLGELQGDLDLLVNLKTQTTGRALELLRSQAKTLRSERNQVYAEVLGLPNDGVSVPSTGVPAPSSGSSTMPVLSHILRKEKNTVERPAHEPGVVPEIPLSELCSGKSPLPIVGNLIGVRALSMSKIQLAGQKGSAKGKDKGAKGTAKGAKGKVKGNEDGQILYVGKDGEVAMVAWYGNATTPLFPDNLVGTLCNISKVRMRPGQLGVVYANAQTEITNCLEPTDPPVSFPYRTAEFCDRFATWKWATESALGTFVDIVVHVWQAEEKFTQNNQEPFMLVSGKDMDGVLIGPLRLWRHTEADIEAGRTYVFRGLVVVVSKMWNQEKWTMVPNPDGIKEAECSQRTAVEDVSDVADIAAYF
jgi:hypothetical protein